MQAEAITNEVETNEIEETQAEVTEAEEIQTPEGSPEVDENSPKNEETELTERINALRSELDELKRSKEEFLKLEAEKNELLLLFPDANADSLPEGVLKEMEKGLPMAAAYALYARREFIKSEAASVHNDSTKKSGFSKIRTESDIEFFSPSEVRAMSKSDVKKNYKRIIQSMKNWH